MAEKGLDPNWKRQMIVRAWRDQAFKEKLLKDPRAAAAEMGYNIPDGSQFKVLEEDTDKLYLVLPQKPGTAALSDEALDLAGGADPAVNTLSCTESWACGSMC